MYPTAKREKGEDTAHTREGHKEAWIPGRKGQFSSKARR